MSGTTIAIVVVAWLLCTLYAHGKMFAYFQDKYPTLAEQDYREDLGFCAGYALLFGPVAAVVSFFSSRFNHYGWRLY